MAESDFSLSLGLDDDDDEGASDLVPDLDIMESNVYSSLKSKQDDMRPSPKVENDDSKPNSAGSQRRGSYGKAFNKMDFGTFDEDDPLAGMLSDDDNSDEPKPKKIAPKLSKQPAASLNIAKQEPKPAPEPSRPKPLHAAKTPTETPKTTPKIPAGRGGVGADVDFSGLDVLGGMGLSDDGPTSKVTAKKKDEPTKKRGLFDDLLGKGSSPSAGFSASYSRPDPLSKLFERPPTGERKDMKMEKADKLDVPGGKREADDDLAFGGYAPSVASSPGLSRSGVRRSVKFGDDESDAGNRPSSAGSVKSSQRPGVARERSAGARPSSVPTSNKSKDVSDWLMLASGQGKKEDDWLEVAKPHGGASSLPGSRRGSVVGTGGNDSRRGSLSNPLDVVPDPLANVARGSSAPTSSAPSKQPKPKDESDYLGLGGDIDIDSLVSVKKPASASLNTPAKMDRISSAPSLRALHTDPAPTPAYEYARSDTNSEIGAPAGRRPVPFSITPEGGSLENTPRIDIHAPSEDSASKIHDSTTPQGHRRQRSRGSALDFDITATPPRQPALSQPPSLSQKQSARSPVVSDQLPTRRGVVSALPTLQSNTSAIDLASTIADENIHMQLHRLKMERDRLHISLELTKSQHSEEIDQMKTMNRTNLDVIEDSYRRRETRLREENEELVRQKAAMLDQTEEEKAMFMSTQRRKISEQEEDHRRQIDRLKELQRISVEQMKSDHNDEIERLKKIKEQELEALTSATSHTRSMNVVMDHIGGQAKELSQLHTKLETTHNSNIDDKLRQVENKNQELRLMEERLTRQQQDNESEKSRMQDLIAKLETHLRELTRQLESERWTLSQDQTRVQSLQKSLEDERRLITEKLTTERDELERAKNSLLTEQKEVLGQLYEERRSIVTERSELEAQQKVVGERERKETVRNAHAEAELEGTFKGITKEQQNLANKAAKLELEQEQLEKAQQELAMERHDVEVEKGKLTELGEQLRRRAEDVESMVKMAQDARDEGVRAVDEARAQDSEQTQRMAALQSQIKLLRSTEKQIMQERLDLSREKRNLDNVKETILCTNCSQPTRDTTPRITTQFGPVMMPPASNSFQPLDDPSARGVGRERVTPPSEVEWAHMKMLHDIELMTQSREVERTLKSMRDTANKEKEYLESESAYLDSLRMSSYLS